MKTYYVQENIGRCKYLVSSHDGEKTHRDGSPFFDVKTFTSKKLMNKFLKSLRMTGYVEKC